jgi:hypothetical protein
MRSLLLAPSCLALIALLHAGVAEACEHASWRGPEVGGSRLGVGIAATDVDGDEQVDIVMGAPWSDRRRGAVYVQRGLTSGSVDVRTLPSLAGFEATGLFGWTIAPVADWTGDGVSELAISAPTARGGGDVFVFGSEDLF